MNYPHDTSPLIQAPASDVPADSRARADRLLVVDDDEINRDLMARRFRRAGYRVRTTRDGQEALRLVEDDPPDLILVDLMMPRMRGLELLKSLRTKHAPSKLPVIMVSALNESNAIVVALTFGANDYITKPVDFSVAVYRIRTQLHRTKADEALLRIEEER